VLWGALLGGVPLFWGAPGGDDAYYHTMYAQQHARCWRGGVAFPRWYPDLNGGLGAPEPRPRPVLPLILHAAIALVTDDAVVTSSIATVLIPLLAGLVAWRVARGAGAPDPVPLLAGMAWAATPYLLVSLHARAAFQEGWALVLLPWVLGACLPPRPASPRQVVEAGVALALLAGTQLLFAFMAGIAIVVAHLASPERRVTRVAGAAGLALGLAAVSWLPNVVSLLRVQGDRFVSGWFDWRRRFLLVGGQPDPDLAADMTWALVGVVAACCIVSVWGGRRARPLALGALAAAAMATPLAVPLYGVLPGLALIQFPWRWLGVASCLVVLAAVRCGHRTLAAVALCALLAVPVHASAWRWRLPAGEPLRPSAGPQAAARAATRFGVPPVLPSFPATVPRDVDLAAALRVAGAARRALPPPVPAGPRTWVWDVEVPVASRVSLPLLVDDAWVVEVDVEPTRWRAAQGLVEVGVPPGTHRVLARQTLLPEDTAGLLLTGVSLVALLGWVLGRARGAGGTPAGSGRSRPPAPPDPRDG
jgi:hypothetical protein